MTQTYKIRNLGCAACAAKMERKIKALPGVLDARVNFITQKLTLRTDSTQINDLVRQAGDIIKSLEPDALLVLPAR